MKITLIAACGPENGIGKNGSIPWHYPKDLKWFKYKTLHKTCMVGKTTYEDMGKLPNRTLWVVSSSLKDNDPITENGKVTVEFGPLSTYQNRISTGSIKSHETLYVCGGESIYQQMLPQADECIITRIQSQHDKPFDCDTFFPNLNQFKKQAEFKLTRNLSIERWEPIAKNT